jgi:hypothetical protein
MNTKSLVNYSKMLLVAGACCLLVQSANATLMFSDGFNYTSGTQLSSDAPWSGGGANITIGSANLTDPPLQDLSPSGNDLTLQSGIASGTAVVNFNPSNITSGTIFFSFLLQPTTMPTGNNELMDLLPSGATGLQGSTAALAIYVGSQNATQYKIGVRHGLSGATYASSAATILGSTSLIVVAYTFNGGVNDDTVSLWLNPSSGSLGGGSAPAADVSFSNSALADSTGLSVVGIKSQGANPQGFWNVDSLRIGDTWADVTPVPEPSTLALVGSGLALMFGMIRRRRS